MKIVKITNSAADEYNILGANTFCDNAELNIATKAEGKPVKNTDISEENENSFDTFLQMIVRKDDKGKLGFTSLMDQAMAKAFSKAPLPEDPVQATQERSIRPTSIERNKQEATSSTATWCTRTTRTISSLWRLVTIWQP